MDKLSDDIQSDVSLAARRIIKAGPFNYGASDIRTVTEMITTDLYKYLSWNQESS